MSRADGLKEARDAAKISVWILVGIGVAEVIVGQFTGSIGLTADGVDSFSDALISMIVWSGLRLSQKGPDERFHFGYYKIESLAALMAAFAMIGIGAAILYKAYLGFLNPVALSYPNLALLTLLGAGTTSISLAFYKRRIAKRLNLLSLQADVNNTFKDGVASFIVFSSVLAASLGFLQMDAVGGMVVSAFILIVSYLTIKEVSLVLVDAFHRPELLEEIKGLVRAMKEVKDVQGIRLRRAGPFISGELAIVVDGSMPVSAMHKIVMRVEEAVKDKIEGMKDLTVKVIPVEG